MKLNGTIQKWNDDKGFGFIRSASESEEFFFHITSFRIRGSRPSIGMEVHFELGKDSQGRKQARNVSAVGIEMSHPAIKAFLLAAIFLILVGVLSIAGHIPKAIFWLYIATSIWSFLLYFIDKSAAEKGRRRTPEATLHNFALIGGWPGALFAQQLLRHKSKKESFRSVFWCTVSLNLVALLYLMSPYGAWLTNEIHGLWG